MEPWIERQKNILDFTLSSLLRRKGKNLALIFVYAFIVFMLGSVLFFTHALKREASIILQEAPEMIVQRTSAGRHNPIPVQYMESIREIRGVQSVRGRLWGYYYDPVTLTLKWNRISSVSHIPSTSAATLTMISVHGTRSALPNASTPATMGYTMR